MYAESITIIKQVVSVEVFCKTIFYNCSNHNAVYLFLSALQNGDKSPILALLHQYYIRLWLQSCT